jgi:linoleoyl-CoA desaturase
MPAANIAETSAKTAPPPDKHSSAKRKNIRFHGSEGFQNELKKRVNAYFTASSKSPRDSFRMYIKTVIILLWFFSSYAVLVFTPLPVWAGILVSISLALAAAGVGFNIQHDGNHGAYSGNRKINYLMALTLDMVGGSSYMWNYKHNAMHHTYSNIHGYDDDIAVGFLGRLCPHQKRFFFHRFQHFYMWGLYGFLEIKWAFFDDFCHAIKGRIGKLPFPRPKGWDLFIFLAGKLFFISLVFVIPVFFHPFWVVCLFYLLTACSIGLIISVIFQLAHCVEEAEFPEPDPETLQMENEWMIHQIETTVNFARKNHLLNWYIGGLNFQIEHHLFPRISHVHYPALSEIVEKTCREFGIGYFAHPTFFSSLRSHYCFLQKMGRSA